ncbi:hypothetical protein ATEIFO6365_0008019100 [Aspergillus terreus]|uniref:Uncharacterized protein n=1 Tax=Aspergillus terreus TaxID=33178 RepID=A0A5M3ZAF7_ASPTE|nr:hypothetical protein ATETN484_0010020000 [Aspergillus terreus]GFF18247.1 hypothetical protein ATEIFO6365_0008019100 [Aspergillus terreus]
MSFARLAVRVLSRGAPIPRTIPPTPQIRLQSTASRAMPRLAQASVWTSMIPKFLRNRGAKGAQTDSSKSKEWNPASFYIIIFILIGSQAIRMIALKNDYAAYTRTTDAKILLLREIIEKVKAGEKVDVERLLGTGDEAKEREWEEVLREIEEEDSLWHKKSKESETKEDPAPQPEPEELKKDTVVPAVGSGTEEPPKDGKTKRKLNFF